MNTKKTLRERLCKPLDDDEACPVCKDIPHLNTKQSSCGHRFCEPCVIKLAGDGLKKWTCPIDKLQVHSMFTDVFYQREIKNAECHCAFESNGCSWKGSLVGLEEHEQGCAYMDATCPECGLLTTKGGMHQHQRDECIHRPVPCRHCSQPVPTNKVEDHDSQCKEVPVACPQGCGATDLVRQSLDDHLLTYCSKTLHACQFEDYGCDYKGTWKEQEKHRLESVDFHMLLLLQTDRQRRAAISRLEEENRLMAGKLDSLEVKGEQTISQEERTDALASQVEEVIETIRSQAKLTKQLEENLSSLSSLGADEARRINCPLEDIEQRLWLLENGSINGMYVWKIDPFPQYLCDAKQGKGASFASAPFYVGRFGYKLFMTVYPNGHGSGQGTHLSVFVTIMKGDYDQLLSWPFSNNIDIRLLSNNTKPDIVKRILPTRQNPCFQRPKLQMNPNCGFPTFCPLSELNRHYMHGDAIYILTDASIPQI